MKTATIESLNPATKEVIGEVPIIGAAQVEEAVGLAWKAFDQWQFTDYNYRAKKVLDLRRVIDRRSDEIANLISTEVGKPLVEAYLSELTGPLESCAWLAENAERHLKDQVIHFSNPLLSSKQSVIAFEPLGVIGVIAPWNYPFAIPMMAMIACVMCGNTVVLKPSEKSPLVGIKIGELFKEAGFPDGVVTIVTGDRTTGEHLSRAKLSKIIFTGSVQGGRNIMAQAAPNVVPVTLELGGKDPAIVLPDAPIGWTAQGLLWGAFTNAGQACASIERVYIIRSKHTQKLIDTIVAKTKELKLGPAADQTTDIGPVIDEAQLTKIQRQVDAARAAGATVLCGGQRRDDLGGFFYEPTVLINVDHSMEIMREETFGPVMPIMVVETEDEAIEKANDSQFGLSASVWSANIGRAEAIARDLSTGTVTLNDCLITHSMPQVPWGGMRQSGIGRSHGQFGLLDLVNVKHINIDSASLSPRIWWHPYGQSRVATARGGLKFLYGGMLSKPLGLMSFVGNMFIKPNKNPKPSSETRSEGT
jgi:succinate-semialdehyde dehydrogenase/glutarate-semialdehyde dehydrogenase